MDIISGTLAGGDVTPPPLPELLVPLSLSELNEVAAALAQLKTDGDRAAEKVEDGEAAEEAAAVDNASVDAREQLESYVIVDLSYDWPKEARPAKERQGAVVKQMTNFAELLRSKRGTLQGPPAPVICSGTGARAIMEKKSFPPVICSGAGVRAIKEKLSNLSPQVETSEVDVLAKIYRPRRLVYLSPDADEFLDTSKGWPKSTVFVVGGLVDRKVKRGRSKARAEQLRRLSPPVAPVGEEGAADEERAEGERCEVSCVQLALTGDDLGAPLNVDTVLSILFYWWAFDAKARQEADPPGGGGGGGLEVEGAFAAAAHCALFEHRQRHPNQGKHTLGL
jgi:hypothetical protein